MVACTCNVSHCKDAPQGPQGSLGGWRGRRKDGECDTMMLKWQQKPTPRKGERGGETHCQREYIRRTTCLLAGRRHQTTQGQGRIVQEGGDSETPQGGRKPKIHQENMTATPPVPAMCMGGRKQDWETREDT